MVDTIIKESGVCEALNCSIEEVKQSFERYCLQSFDPNVDYSRLETWIKVLFEIGDMVAANDALDSLSENRNRFILDSDQPLNGFLDQIEKSIPEINAKNRFN